MNEIIICNGDMPCLLSSGHLSAHEPFYHADRIVDFNVLIYCIKGTIFVTEEDIDYELCGGDMLFLKSKLHHFGKKEIKKGAEWMYAHFCISSKKKSCEILELPKIMRNMSGTEAASLFERLIEYGNTDLFENNWYKHSVLFSLLSEIALYNRKIQKPRTIIDEICKFLTENSTKSFTAASLVDRFYLSYKYMAYMFKKSMGMTMQQFHTKVRIEQACNLLDSSMLTIGEIANKIGYSDMLYFSRIFKRETGYTPTDFRRRLTIHQKGF